MVKDNIFVILWEFGSGCEGILFDKECSGDCVRVGDCLVISFMFVKIIERFID